MKVGGCVLELLLWAGLVVSVVGFGGAVYNAYWSLAEIVCPTHLGHPLLSIFFPASEFDKDRTPLFYIRWLKARAQLRRQVLYAGLLIVVADSWRSHLTGVFTLTGLWITIPATIFTVWTVLADSRVIALLRQMPQEMSYLNAARAEKDRESCE